MDEQLVLKDLYRSWVLTDLQPITSEQKNQMLRYAREELHKGTWPIGNLEKRRAVARKLLELGQSPLSAADDERVGDMADVLWSLASEFLLAEHMEATGPRASEDNDAIKDLSASLQAVTDKFDKLSAHAKSAIGHALKPMQIEHQAWFTTPQEYFRQLLGSLKEVAGDAELLHRKRFVEITSSAARLHAKAFGEPNDRLSIALRDLLDRLFPHELIKTGSRDRFCQAFAGVHEIAKGECTLSIKQRMRYAEKAFVSQSRKRTVAKVTELHLRLAAVESVQRDHPDASPSDLEYLVL